jgi:cytochrome b6-f complex iron-sulfur subunit
MHLQQKIDRNEFLKKLGLTGSALLAVYCTGGLGACSNSTVSPSTSANFNLDLTTTLLNVGNSVTQNGVVVARIATGNAASSFVAVSQTCPHEGRTQVYFKGSSSSGFACSAHNAAFSISGACTNGVTSGSLQILKTSVSGTTLTVTS